MQITDILAQVGGLHALSRELGASESQAAAGTAALAPAILGGSLGGQPAGANSGGSGAPSGMAAMLDGNGDGNALDDILRMAGKAFR